MIGYDQLAALWRDARQPLRDRALWALLYETAPSRRRSPRTDH